MSPASTGFSRRCANPWCPCRRCSGSAPARHCAGAWPSASSMCSPTCIGWTSIASASVTWVRPMTSCGGRWSACSRCGTEPGPATCRSSIRFANACLPRRRRNVIPGSCIPTTVPANRCCTRTAVRRTRCGGRGRRPRRAPCRRAGRTGRDVPRSGWHLRTGQRDGRKHSRNSRTKSAGCSRAAKCPPRSTSFQYVIRVKVSAAQ